MKDTFPEYYSSPNFKELWKSAVFVFDANVLLDLYRLAPKISMELLVILENLSNEERIWIPHQFAYEYHKNLSSVRDAVKSDYEKSKEELSKLAKTTKNKLCEFRTRSDFSIKESEIVNVEQGIRDIIPSLETFASSHLERLERDNLEDNIAKLFAGNVGQSDSDPRIKAISGIGRDRFERGIPPGIKDESKRGKSDPYGDLIGWFQIIAHARETALPVILITNDSKGNDWFLMNKRKRVEGPRPELIREMRDEAQVDFYLYQTMQFTRFARIYLKSTISDEAIVKIDKLRRDTFTARVIRAHLGEFLTDELLGFPNRMRRHSRTVDLSGADLQDANLSGKDLEASNLQGADLRGANLEDTQLQGANLRDAKLEGAVIINTDLRGADLRNVDLQQAYFYYAELSGAKLQNTKWQGHNLEMMSLRFANLADANLGETTLTDADLEYALLQGANLQDAEFTDATLPDGTKYDDGTDMRKFTDPTHPQFAETLRVIQVARREYGFKE